MMKRHNSLLAIVAGLLLVLSSCDDADREVRDFAL